MKIMLVLQAARQNGHCTVSLHEAVSDERNGDQCIS